jgi:hypothetical protein
MSNASRTITPSTGVAHPPAGTVRMDALSYLASQRDVLVASLLLRPDKADADFSGRLSWLRP